MLQSPHNKQVLGFEPASQLKAFPGFLKKDQKHAGQVNWGLLIDHTCEIECEWLSECLFM